MDVKSVQCLADNIYRFNHLVSCLVLKTMPAEKNYRSLVSFLKHLKPLLDNVADLKVHPNDFFTKECEELDAAIHEAMEFLDKWFPKMSKILFVLQSEPLVIRIRISSVKICCILCRLIESSPSTSIVSDTQESRKLHLEELSQEMEEVLKSQREGKIPRSEHLMTIIQYLNLTSDDEVMNESIALEKERMKAEDNKLKGGLDKIHDTMCLMSHIRDCIVKLKNYKAINGIKVPPYFRCPLCLELMLDPVIVASGQTYERGAIQKWFDHGLYTCPKTCQKLSHQNLIPNFTVKALIANWCEENKIELSNNVDGANNLSVESHSEQVCHDDDIQYPLQRKNSTSRNCFKVLIGNEKQKVDDSSRVGEEDVGAFSNKETISDYSSPEPSYIHSRSESASSATFRYKETIADHSSPEPSSIHSRSESASSATFSTDYVPTASTEISRILSKQDNVSDISGDVTSDYCTYSPSIKNSGVPPSNKSNGVSPSLSGKQCHSSKDMAEMNGYHKLPRTLSFPSESGSTDMTTTSRVEKLVKDLKSGLLELQTAAAKQLRFLAKYNMENRIIIGRCGAIAPLISLLHSDVNPTQEHAVTALLNLSINEKIKAMIAEEGTLEPLIHVLRTGNSGAKENAAATIFSLSFLDEYRMKIGQTGAVKALVDLLASGTLRGKKDAATALFNLSIYHENKARVVQAGAVKYLVELMDPGSEIVDKAVAVLANLSTTAEGCSAIAQERGIPLLVEIVETGSQQGKENASSILLQLCIISPKYCLMVLQEGAVPPLVALSQSGTTRAKEKAQQLLSHFRNQREGAVARGRS
ncbi:U-box domain-containing protein 3-like isoform X2 [Olea europaea var. sylvestris]|uniref:U-box domain-containing protein 3-like isoform X2 n=1 Tax=Olea europaea var. sylvestris TaxID=158386 RepID=UPI000C1D7F87|nr:U-box domain-containing protein 3-like isoform X2 [Olea europaea var. sylvestris]